MSTSARIWIDDRDLQLRFSQMGCRSVLFRSMRMEEYNDKCKQQDSKINRYINLFIDGPYRHYPGNLVTKLHKEEVVA